MEYGCIGEKLTHSFSKEIHARLFDYQYELKEIPRDELDAFMRAREFKAINVTIPYKQAVIPYLDEISGIARKIGAVNTIVNRGGKLYGDNTDFSGMTALIRKNGIVLADKKVLILGSGGTSKTAYAVAQSLGAREVYRVSRSENDGCISYETAHTAHADAEILINTTPCGMFPHIGSAAVELADFSCLSGVIDAIYNPLRSALVQAALERGIPATGGLYMLVAQAVFAAEKFTDSEIEPAKTDAVFAALRREKENIVLIGMPGCGKTTTGKQLAEECGMTFLDTDEEIIRQEQRTIPEIFAGEGEAGFRAIEAEVIRKVSARQNCVIATGGGAVLRAENVALLKENGRLYFLDRPLEKLAMTDDRPLSSDFEKLKQRFCERYDIYCRAADRHIACGENIRSNITAIKEDFER